MNYFDVGVIVFIALSAIVMAIYYFFTKKPLKSLLIGSLSGVGTLVAAKIVSAFAGFAVSVNVFTLLTSAILGIPGAACTIILNVIFNVAV